MLEVYSLMFNSNVEYDIIFFLIDIILVTKVIGSRDKCLL